jgi:hypothetical protein
MDQKQFDGFSYRGDNGMGVGSMQAGSYMGANARLRDGSGSYVGSFRGPSNRRY